MQEMNEAQLHRVLAAANKRVIYNSEYLHDGRMSKEERVQIEHELNRDKGIQETARNLLRLLAQKKS